MDRSSLPRGRVTKQTKMELYPRYSQALGNGRQASMERLNDILTRAMQRRQHTPEQTERSERYPIQGPPPYDSEGQRQRVPPPPARTVPPLREQRARLGQPNPYGTVPQNGQTLSRRYSTPAGQQGQGELH